MDSWGPLGSWNLQLVFFIDLLLWKGIRDIALSSKGKFYKCIFCVPFCFQAPWMLLSSASDAFVVLCSLITLLVEQTWDTRENEKYKRERKRRSYVKMGRWRGYWMCFKSSFIIPTKGVLLKANSRLRHKAKGMIEVRRN